MKITGLASDTRMDQYHHGFVFFGSLSDLHYKVGSPTNSVTASKHGRACDQKG